MDTKQSIFVRFLNFFLPTKYELGNKEEIRYQAHTEFAEYIGELKGYIKELDTEVSPKQFSAVQVTVSSETAKNYYLEQGWFSDFNIKVDKEKARSATEGVGTNVSSNFSLSTRELDVYQNQLTKDACYARFRTDPLYGNAIYNLRNYTVGKGAAISCVADDFIDVVNNFNRINKFNFNTKLEGKLAFRHFVEGDNILYCTVNPMNGDMRVHFIETYELAEWEVSTKNRDTVLAYHINTGNGFDKWVAHYEYFDEIYNGEPAVKDTSDHHSDLSPYEFIIHIKDDTFPEFLGRPLATPALKYFKWAEDFIRDRVILNHEKARVVYKKKISGQRSSGRELYKKSLPASSGMVLIETDDVSYDVMNLRVGADDVKEDYLSILYAICAAFNMPIHVLGLRAAEQVYASVFSAKAPFTKAIENWQAFISSSLMLIYFVQLREKYKAGLLSKKYKVSTIKDGERVNRMVSWEEVPLFVTFPSPVDENLAERTQFSKMAIEYNLVSRRTQREQLGLSDEEERLRLAEEEGDLDSMPAVRMRKQPTSVPDPLNKDMNDAASRAGNK